MTQEEKSLLLQDLCARLPYGVEVLSDIDKKFDGGWIGKLYNIGRHKEEWLFHQEASITPFTIDEIRPYLRPMDSMTEEEIEEYRNLSDEVIGSYGPYHHKFIAHCVRLGIKPDNPNECVDDFLNMEAIDWLSEHHFDYRGLIPMGLALEAPEGIYDIKTE